MMIFLDLSIQDSEYPNVMTYFKVHIFRPAPPSTNTRLILCLLTYTSRYNGLLLFGCCIGRYCLENVT